MGLKLLVSIIFTITFIHHAAGEMKSCDRYYTKRGCYPGKRNILPVLLDERREEIVWNNFEEYIHKLACHCASLAKKRGFKLFGLRFYGECYGGNNVVRFENFAHREKIPTKHCISHDYQQCYHHDSRECVGTDNGEYIYEIKENDEQVTDGGFGRWSEWSDCSSTCGEGRRSRERLCNNPEPFGAKAKDCSNLGDYTENEKCSVRKCPVDGGYGDWSAWSACSKKCGTGQEMKTRQCNNPSPKFGGKDCRHLGAKEETRECNKNKCLEIPCHFAPGDSSGGTETMIGAKPSINQCIKACVEMRKKDRTINGVTIPYGTKLNGKVSACYCERNWKKPGHSTSWKTCQMDLSKEKVDGGFTQWTSWSECSKTCGGGLTKRTRTCTNPAPKNGGLECVGETTENKSCNEDTCSKIPCTFAPGDSSGGTETMIGAKPSINQCIKACVEMRKKDRTINGVTIPYGTTLNGKVSACYCERKWKKPGHSTSWKTCQMDLSKEIVDGGFTQWTSWSECSKTCGGGLIKRTRTCTNPAPKNGGLECVGETTETKSCNEDKCSDVLCHFAPGDSSGGTETMIGAKSSINQCIEGCVEMRKKDRTINGVTIPYGTKLNGRVSTCYCERNWRKPGHGTSWKTCQMDLSKEIVNGAFTQWTPWSECSKTCGGGLIKRTRTCTNPAPKNGGLECVGETTESKPCNEDKCSEIRCHFAPGDSSGGRETMIVAKPSINQCIKACVEMRKKDLTINGVTIPYGTKLNGKVSACYCERNWKKPGHSTSWKTCQMDL